MRVMKDRINSVRPGYFLWIGIVVLFTACGKSKSGDPEEPGKPVTETPTTIKSGQTVKVMTYNIHHGNPPAQSEGVIDLAAIAAVINSEDPDFVALQEVDKNTKRSGVNLNEAQELAARTKRSVFFSKSIDYDGGEYGVAVLSKYTIVDRIRYSLPLAAGATGELRSVAIISVAAEGGSGKFYFASTHLEVSDANSRMTQVQELLRINSGIQSPFVLAGDFNAVPTNEAITTLQQSFTAGCLSGCPLTSPATNPTRTIDYVFLNQQASAAFTVLSYRTADEAVASDHRAVVAELKYK